MNSNHCADQLKRVQGLVLGVSVPVILTSRADSVRSRIAGCAQLQSFTASPPTNPP